MHSISRDLHLKWQFKKNGYFQLFKVNNVNSVVNKHTNWLEMGWTPYFRGCFPFNRTKRCRPSFFFRSATQFLLYLWKWVLSLNFWESFFLYSAFCMSSFGVFSSHHFMTAWLLLYIFGTVTVSHLNVNQREKNTFIGLKAIIINPLINMFVNIKWKYPELQRACRTKHLMFFFFFTFKVKWC